MVERSLSMREVMGSIPISSKLISAFLNKYFVFDNVIIFKFAFILAEEYEKKLHLLYF